MEWPNIPAGSRCAPGHEGGQPLEEGRRVEHPGGERRPPALGGVRQRPLHDHSAGQLGAVGVVGVLDGDDRPAVAASSVACAVWNAVGSPRPPDISRTPRAGSGRAPASAWVSIASVPGGTPKAAS
jgi:hypothetical protein